MCLGIPGRITEVWDEDGAPMAHADFAGQVRRVCLAYLPELTVGDFVITHMGYALTRLTEEDAADTLATMREYGVLDVFDPPGQPEPDGLAAADPASASTGTCMVSPEGACAAYYNFGRLHRETAALVGTPSVAAHG